MIVLIVIIALLLAISIVLSIFYNNKKVEKTLNCDNLIEDISSTAIKYVNDNRDELNNYRINDYEYKMYANTLISNNYLSSSIINPFTGEEIDASKVGIKILLTNSYEIDEIIIVNASDIEIDCKDSSTFDFSLDDSNDDTISSDDDGSVNSSNSSSETPEYSEDDNQDDIEGVKPDVDNDVAKNDVEVNDEDENKVSDNMTKDVKYVNKFPDGAYCAQGIDEFYYENGTTYYFTCQMSQYVYVIVDGVEYGLVDALESGIVTIEEVEEAKGSKFLSKSRNVSVY